MTVAEQPQFIDAPPKATRHSGRESQWKPVFDMLAQYPATAVEGEGANWAQVSQEPFKGANATAANLRQGLTAGIPGYDRAQITVNGETYDFPVPGEFEVTSRNVDEDEQGNKLGHVYARALSDEVRKVLVKEIKDKKRKHYAEKQKNGTAEAE